MSKFYEVGYNDDEHTRFCKAESEKEAKEIFINLLSDRDMDYWLGIDQSLGIEDWRTNVWAKDITNRFISNKDLDNV